MTDGTTVVSVVSGSSAVAAGVAVLPNTSGNSIIFSLALAAIVVGAIVLISTVAAKVFRPFA